MVELEDTFIIFEFKLNGSAQEALEQIKNSEYAQKYRLEGKELILVGVNFSTKTRAVSEWKVEKDSGADSKPSAAKEAKEKEAQEAQKQALLAQAQQIARHLLAQGLDTALVAQSTDLSIEEVQALTK